MRGISPRGGAISEAILGGRVRPAPRFALEWSADGGAVNCQRANGVWFSTDVSTKTQRLHPPIFGHWRAEVEKFIVAASYNLEAETIGERRAFEAGHRLAGAIKQMFQ